jgi:hypothetical protein
MNNSLLYQTHFKNIYSITFVKVTIKNSQFDNKTSLIKYTKG